MQDTLTMVQKLQELGALAMVAVAMAVVGYLALNGNETAAGALIGVISSATSFYLRGRVQTPTTTGTGSGAVTVTPSVTVTGQPPSE